MISSILSLMGGFKGAIVGVLSLLAGLFGLFWKGRYNQERAAKERYAEAVKMHEAKEKVNQHDAFADGELDKSVELLREKVEHAESPEAGAEDVSAELDKYFGGKN